MMNIQELAFTLTLMSVLLLTAVPMSSQMNERESRDEVGSMIRSQLHLKPDQFRSVQRDETLEQKLMLVAGNTGTFLYRISQAGDEVKEHSVVHHIFTDVNPRMFKKLEAIENTGRGKMVGLNEKQSNVGSAISSTPSSNPRHALQAVQVSKRVPIFF